MKKFILISLLLITGSLFIHPVTADAQQVGTDIVTPVSYVGLPSYTHLKTVYDHRGYMPAATDRFIPIQITFASVFVPGLGQILSGEYARGALFLSGTTTLAGIAVSLVNSAGQNNVKQSNKDIMYGFALGALAADLGIWIWNIIDANHVAKVKDMYLQDLLGGRSQSKANISFEPSLNVIPGNNNYHPAAGLAMRLNF